MDLILAAGLLLTLTGVPAAAQSTGEPYEPTHPGLTQAQPKKRVEPGYPGEAFRKDRPDGKVLLRLLVDQGGYVLSAEVIEATPAGQGFEKAASLAARQWRYKPARLGKKPVRSYAYVEMTFTVPEPYCKSAGSDEIAVEPGYPQPGDDFPDVAAGDRLPRLVSKSQPEYPAMPRKAGIMARVYLQAKIDLDGSVVDVCVVDSNQPNLGFEEAAMAAVEQWRYEPAMIRGTPVPVWFNVMVDFSLRF